MAHISRFKKKDSTRSGFSYLEQELVKDEGSLVGPDEFDEPNPAKKHIGGEGQVSPGNTRSDYTSYIDSANLRQTKFITAAGGISFETASDKAGERNPNASWLLISGSNTDITITADPQITAAEQNQQLTLECVGSSITLQDGNGLDLRRIYTMTSGSILNLFYSATDNLWHETSRGRVFGSLGEL